MTSYNPRFQKSNAFFGSEGIPNNDEDTFKTTDLFWAAFCRAKGLKLVKIQQSNGKFIEVILEGKNAQEIAQGYLRNESIPVKDFVDLFKPLRDDVLRFRNQ